MDTQTVQAMQENRGGNLNTNGTTTPSHLIPENVAKEAAKRTASMLLSGTTPEVQHSSVNVQQMADIQAAQEQQQKNREEIAKRVSAKLNPGGAPVGGEVAEPVVVTEPAKETLPEENTEQPKEAATSDEDIEGLSPDADIDPKREDFKKVRADLKEHKRTAKELLQVKTELEDKVKKYETGELVTEETKKLKEKIQQLEPLQHLINLKTSDEYNESFLEPLKTEESKLGEIAKDYNIPAEVMNEAVKLTNRKQLNTFLLEYFDEVGASEAKQAIQNIQRIRGELKKAEDAPQQALERLTQERLQMKMQQENRRRDQIINTSKNSWMSALLNIRNQGKIAEVIPRENDPEFNSKWVEPLTNKASEEFGKFVTYLGQNGLSELDPEFGKGLATTTLLATVATTAIERANAAEKKLAELQENTRRVNTMLRPGIGTSRGGGSTAMPSQKPSSPQETARLLLRQQGVNI